MNTTEWHSHTRLRQGCQSPFCQPQKDIDLVQDKLLLHNLYSRNVPHCLVRWFFPCLENRIGVISRGHAWERRSYC